jgi:hypothetical protein
MVLSDGRHQAGDVDDGAVRLPQPRERRPAADEDADDVELEEAPELVAASASTWPPSSSCEQKTTRAPAAANTSTVARPIPFVPPVTMATLPL